ncbi:MAG: molybdopterin molybdotransferase MoeA [Phycisphaeraceae bacterium]|nr:molybdopterin molybdotransferase MoeA [Phycisphaeraceae bacterium]
MPELIPYPDALDRMLAHCPVLDTRRVELEAAAGRCLREPICADRDQPPFNRSAMDGFAVVADQITPGEPIPVVGEVPAGGDPASVTEALANAKGPAVVRIATGAALPEALDSVIPIEKATVSTGPDGERVRFDQTPSPGANIHRRGADAAAGDQLIPAGVPLTAAHLGIAAAAGVTELTVGRRPRVVLLTTGDEVRPPATPADDLAIHQIRNSNGPMSADLLIGFGAELIRHEHVADDPTATRTAAERALADADLVVTVGGVSVGRRDHLPATWENLSLQTVLHGVRMKPGKPVLIAADDAEHKLVIGLPGNPVSVLVAGILFAGPAVARMAGIESARVPFVKSVLAEPTRTHARRQQFRPAVRTDDGRVRVLPWQGSGDLCHTAAADGLVALPPTDGELNAGDTVDYVPLPR